MENIFIIDTFALLTVCEEYTVNKPNELSSKSKNRWMKNRIRKYYSTAMIDI